jgi:hypothetical protein
LRRSCGVCTCHYTSLFGRLWQPGLDEPCADCRPEPIRLNAHGWLSSISYKSSDGRLADTGRTRDQEDRRYCHLFTLSKGRMSRLLGQSMNCQRNQRVLDNKGVLSSG